VPISVIIWNPTGQTVYLGGRDVTTANGFPITAGSFSPAIDLVGEHLYAVVAATTQAVNVLGRGV
jgi:hypothetical protein